MTLSCSEAPDDKLEVAYIMLERTGGVAAKARVSTVQSANHVLLQWASTLASTHCEICNIHIHFEDGFACHACYKIDAAKKRISIARELRDPMSSLSVSSLADGGTTVSIENAPTVSINGSGWSITTILDRYDI